MKKSTKHAGFRAVFYSNTYLYLIHVLAGIGLAGIFFLSSCSPIKRHARLVEKYPFVHTTDTVTYRDTIRVEIPKVKVDTIVSLKELRDTITIEKDRLKIKLYTVHDSIFVSGVCDTITIEKEVIRKVPVKYYIHKQERSWLKFVMLLAMILFALYAVFRNRNKETVININDEKNDKIDPPTDQA